MRSGVSAVVLRLGDGRRASVDSDTEFYAASTFKLAVLYEVPKDEIDPLLLGLKDKLVDQAKFGVLAEKAKMTAEDKEKLAKAGFGGKKKPTP